MVKLHFNHFHMSMFPLFCFICRKLIVCELSEKSHMNVYMFKAYYVNDYFVILDSKDPLSSPSKLCLDDTHFKQG